MCKRRSCDCIDYAVTENMMSKCVVHGLVAVPYKDAIHRQSLDEWLFPVAHNT